MQFIPDLILGASIAMNIHLFQVGSDFEDLLLVILCSIYIMSRLLVMLSLTFCRLSRYRLALILSFYTSVVCQVELCMMVSEKIRKNPGKFGAFFVTESQSLLISILCIEIGRILVPEFPNLPNYFIAIYVSFRKNYTGGHLVLDLVYSAMLFFFMAGYTSLDRSVPQNLGENLEDKCPERHAKISTGEDRIRSKKSRYIIGRSSHIISESKEIVTARNIFEVTKREEGSLKNTELATKRSFTDLFKKPEVKKKEEAKLPQINQFQVDDSAKPSTEYDYLFVVDSESLLIEAEEQHTFEKKKLEHCKLLRQKIMGQMKVMLFKDPAIVFNSNMGNGLAMSEQETEVWKYDPNTEAQNKSGSDRRHRFLSKHENLNELLNELSEELVNNSQKKPNQKTKSFISTATQQKTKTQRKRGPSKSIYSHDDGRKSEHFCSERDIGSTHSIVKAFKIKSFWSMPQSLELFCSVILPDECLSGNKEEDAENETIIDLTFRPVITIKERDKKESIKIWIFVKCKESICKTSRPEELLNYVSHEMRTPLLSILGTLNLFVRDATKESFYLTPAFKLLKKKYLDLAHNQVMNLHETCQVLLEMSKPGGSSRKKINSIEIHLEQLIYDTVQVFSLDLTNNPKKKVVIDYFGQVSEYNPTEYKMNQDQTEPRSECKPSRTESKPAKQIDTLYNDPVRIRQIIINLLSNALKYTDKGEITIKTQICGENSRKNNLVKISVIDSGIGIREQDKQKLFKAFGTVNGEKDNAMNSKGVGLGLLISNKMSKQVSEQNIKTGIQVNSEVNKGSTFSFYVENLEHNIPDDNCQVSRDMEISNIDTSIPDKNPSKIRIFWVDDSEFNLELVKDILEELEVEVVTCNSPFKSLKIIKETLNRKCTSYKLFHLCIFDYEMPRMNGAELAAKVRQMGGCYDNIPIICASAQKIDLSEKENHGFTDQIEKPIFQANLLKIMRKYLRHDQIQLLKAKERGNLDGSNIRGESCDISNRIDGLARNYEENSIQLYLPSRELDYMSSVIYSEAVNIETVKEEEINFNDESSKDRTIQNGMKSKPINIKSQPSFYDPEGKESSYYSALNLDYEEMVPSENLKSYQEKNSKIDELNNRSKMNLTREVYTFGTPAFDCKPNTVKSPE